MLIRPLQNETETNQFFLRAIDIFSSGSESEAGAQRWRRFVETSPQYDPVQVRGAFRGDEMVGGYICYERTLAFGSARLLTGCIGAVFTVSEQRMQGIGRALLNDAIIFSQARNHALIFLDGIPNFYHRFGFVNVIENSVCNIQIADVLALPPSPCQIRDATLDDAETLARLYHQEFDPIPGVFARTLAIQNHHLAGRVVMNPPQIAIDETGEAVGYLVLYRPPTSATGVEIVTNHWGAASALVQHHARLLAADNPTADKLKWQVPPGSATFFTLADHIPMEGSAQHLPIGDWMARIGHLPTFLESILPFWHARWRQSNVFWLDPIVFDLGEANFCLDFGNPTLSLLESPPPETARVRLTPQALMQLTFGFRPAGWLARQPSNHIPDHLIEALQALAPARCGWVPGTDRF